MKRNEVHGLRLFLMTVLDLIVQGKTETCDQVEAALASGIATKLYNSYNSQFDENEFSADNLSAVDEYYQQWANVADSQEFRKYNCGPNDGLSLIIKLALNEIF